MSSFPIQRLPSVVLDEIIKFMVPIEIFHLSQTSSKLRRYIQSFQRKYPVQLKATIKPDDMHLTFGFGIDLDTEEPADDRTSKLIIYETNDKLDLKSSSYSFHLDVVQVIFQKVLSQVKHALNPAKMSFDFTTHDQILVRGFMRKAQQLDIAFKFIKIQNHNHFDKIFYRTFSYAPLDKNLSRIANVHTHYNFGMEEIQIWPRGPLMNYNARNVFIDETKISRNGIRLLIWQWSQGWTRFETFNFDMEEGHGVNFKEILETLGGWKYTGPRNHKYQNAEMYQIKRKTDDVLGTVCINGNDFWFQTEK